MAAVPIRSVPSLQGKAGEEIVSALGIRTIGDLHAFTKPELQRSVGRDKTLFLLSLRAGGAWEDVRGRVKQKSVLVERSCPPTAEERDVRSLLQMLARQIVSRLEEEEEEGESGVLDLRRWLDVRLVL